MKGPHILLFAIFIFVFHGSTALRILKKVGRIRNNVGIPRDSLDIEDQWVDQYLDHFNPTDTRTWKQRYFTNDSFYKPGGPVFFLIGGEGEASSRWMIEGAWIEYAMKLNALCFQVEHRYYGKSHPTDDLSVENMVYLSSEQALADLANFIVTMTKEQELPEGTKWIAFGGSYSGALAAWLRAKYSHLVHAAVSASGPLLAKLNFKEYLGVVRNSLATAGEACVDAVSDTFSTLDFKSQNLKEIFNLCDDTDDLSENDISNFYETLADNMAGVVQYNEDNRNSPTKNITINYVCDILTDDTIGTPIERYGAVNSILLEAEEQECLDFKYDKVISEIQNTSWDSDAAGGYRQWIYQTCTEFGYYQTSDDSPHIFGESFNLNFFIQQCTDIYGPEFNYTFVRDSIDRTNAVYGALSIDVSRVVYVHGTIDPWHVLGITESISNDAPAILINGTAHCADMYPSSPNDIPELVETRTKILQYITEWLEEQYV